MKNTVQLISYPDSLGGSLAALRDVLEGPLKGVFGGVHLLPPYPSSGDRGFAPLTYFEIDPRFGTWEDIRRLSGQVDLLVDVMVNHISRRSPAFQDFVQRGRASPSADLFLTLDKVWPGGHPRPEDVARIFLRKPGRPFTEVRIEATGEVERVWSTFGAGEGSEQIDLDVNANGTREMLRAILAHLSRQGIRMVRLDAVAFVIKKPGTSCFFVEPEIYAFIDWIAAEARAAGIELLLEVHAEFPIQQRLAAHGCRIYNFALPLLVLHALLRQDSRALKAHLQVCPPNQVTMLDCHDGIPVQPDVNGILDPGEAQQVVQICLERGANLSRILSAAHRQREDFDAHQINITYYAALGAREDAYLAARAIQFFAPGVPQVYYVGLLAGENDPAEVARTGERRAINRHNYTTGEIETGLGKPVVQRLLRLIRFRNETPAFSGDFEVGETDEHTLQLAWRKGEDWAALRVDLRAPAARITYRAADGTLQEFAP